MARVKLLRTTLFVRAALWALWGLVTGIVPRWLARTVLSQPPLGEYAWVRAAAVMAVVLAMLMVLVAQRLEELWWWSWAFVLLELGTAAVLVLNALAGLPTHAAAWPWWAGGAVSAAFAALLLLALGQIGMRRQPE